MAVALAAVGSFVAAGSAISAAGGVLAAMSTVAGFLSVAGAALTGIGALTGKKDVMKLGGLMSLGGAVSGALGGAAAGSAAGSAAGEAAGDAALLAGPEAASTAHAAVAPSAFQSAFQPLQSLTNAGAAEPVAQAPSLMQQQVLRAANTGAPTQALNDAVAQAGRGMTSSEVDSLLASAWDRTKAALGGVNQFMRDNPALTTIGGNMLSSMYGPEAEQLDMQRSLLARRHRNLNSPIPLGPVGPGA